MSIQLPSNMPVMGQGPAVEATPDDEHKDYQVGFTHPNLHRRVDPKEPTTSYEVSPRDYQLGIYNVDSYRTTVVHIQEELSETSELP